MRKTIGLGLTTMAFAFGLIIGAVDSRTAHIVVSTAQARPKGGEGIEDCDGYGTPPSCATCRGGACNQVCVGRSHCVTNLAGDGTSECMTTSVACASGGTPVVVGGTPPVR